MKTCSKCGEVKKPTSFGKAAQGRLKAECKHCAQTRVNAWKKAHRERVRTLERERIERKSATGDYRAVQAKPCSSCLRVLPPAMFYRDRAKSTGLSSLCKRCADAKAVAWKERHPDKAAMHQAKCRLKPVGGQRDRSKKYREAHLAEVRAYARALAERSRAELRPSYVAARIKRSTGLAQPTLDHLAAKRAELKLKRLIKEMTQ